MNALDARRRFFITTDFLDINFGRLEFKKVKEYDVVSLWMPLLQVAEHQIKQECLDSAKKMGIYDDVEINKLISKLKNTSMISLIQQNPYPLKNTAYSRKNYITMFKYFFIDFDENKFDMISNNKEFNMIRDLIIEAHGQEPDREPVNAMLADYNRKQKELMRRSGQSASFEAMYTSVFAYTGNDPGEMTMYKFHKLFERINRIFNYESRIFLKPYEPKDAGEIKPWYADSEKERKMISKEDFDKQVKTKRKI